MISGLGVFGAGGGGYGVTASSSASSGPNVFGGGSTMFGGINTGTQGVDITMLAVIGAVVVLTLYALRK